ncbi:MAG: gamma-glutamyltransferase family protein [Phycisphaerales bacterium]
MGTPSSLRRLISLLPCHAVFVLLVLVAAIAGCNFVHPRERIEERFRGEIVRDRLDADLASRFVHEAAAADHPEASQAGAEVLAQGGNAVDAAVAASFALSVVRPESCGIGGGGFMVIHLAGGPRRGGAAGAEPATPRNIVIDYRERAPASASPRMFVDLPADASRWSGAGVAVPGTVAGLLHAHEKYGMLDRAAVLAPAIRLARNGYIVDAHTRRQARVLEKFLDERPDRPRLEGRAARETFIPTPVPREEGVIVLNPDRVPPQRAFNLAQAEALEAIARFGVDGFYKGPVAQAMVNAAQRHAPEGTPALTLNDLASVSPREATPLTASWRGKTILTMPLPSSGGMTLIQTLALMERTRGTWSHALEGAESRLEPFQRWKEGQPAPEPVYGPAYIHALAEAMKHAFADRALYLGDPAFMPADPTARLLDEARLDRKAASMKPGRELHINTYKDLDPLPDLLSEAADAPDDHGTSHLSAVDRWGNAVSCTETINLAYGSRILVTEYGFFLNNQMDDFQTRPGEPNAFGLIQSDRNAPATGKCPLSSMTPTIVLDAEGRVETAVGGSGGPRIITAVAQSLLLAEEPQRRLQRGMLLVGSPFILSAILAASGFGAGQAAGAPIPEAELQAALGRPESRMDMLENWPESAREAWTTFESANGTQIDGWLNSNDGPTIAVALHIIDLRGDVNRIAQCSALLNSSLVGLRVLTTGAIIGPVTGEVRLLDADGTGPVPIAKHVVALYRQWFGVDLRCDPGWPCITFEQAFGDITDFSALGYPRLIRLERAINEDFAPRLRRGEPWESATTGEPHTPAIASIFAEILTLPEEARWPIVVEGQRRGVITEARAKSVLAGLSPALRDRINGSQPTTSPEPAFRAQADMYGLSRRLNEHREAAKVLLAPAIP